MDLGVKEEVIHVVDSTGSCGGSVVRVWFVCRGTNSEG